MRADLVAAVAVLARFNVPPDIQELLLFGNPRLNIKPGALSALLNAMDAEMPGAPLDWSSHEHAWLLRAEGLMYIEIGRRLGVTSGQARQMVKAFGVRVGRASKYARWSSE